jgi:hypothetical protein
MNLSDFARLPENVIERVSEIMGRYPNISKEEEDFIQSLMPDAVNPCGDCTLCCTAPAIEANVVSAPLTAPKPAGQACEYCDGAGCMVYDRRPDICKSYMCFYSLGFTNNSPKDTGICWSAQPPGEAIPGQPEAWVATGHSHAAEDAMQNERNVNDMARLLNMGAVMVIVRDADKVMQFVPKDGGPVGPGTEMLLRITPVDQTDPMRQAWVFDAGKTHIITLR